MSEIQAVISHLRDIARKASSGYNATYISRNVFDMADMLERLAKQVPATAEEPQAGASTQAAVTPLRVKRLRKCIEVIEGYGQFHEGQDGFQALFELRQFVDELGGKLSPYGYCPHCGKAGIERERRPNGNDRCESGHVYPSRSAR